MKKYIYLIIAIIVMGIVYINVNADEVVIPDSAIRVRVIANSNSLVDQDMKLRVTEYLQTYLSPLLVDVSGIEEARDIINDKLGEINDSVGEILKDNNYDMGYSVNFGDNYFPNKEYKGVKYKAGEYESLVVTLGTGGGDNWWCVLFPPLCLLDATDDDSSDIEYKLWVQELIEKYF